MLRIYNTITRKIEEFKPLNPPQVTYYSCGPTVYDYAHIGHARTYVFNDVLERAVEFNGYKVKRVMNITDVGHLTSDADTGEDKMEKGARRERKTVWQIAEFYTEDFFRMARSLNINTPQIVCKATDHIPEMIELIKELEQKGFTYKIKDGIYFDTSKLKNYGKLTGQTYEKLSESLKAGVRVEIVEGKRNITDFALWKFSYPGGRSFDSAQDDAAAKRQMEWDSPWGKGFPGWHIECSAMSMENLDQTIDIHTGGVDHIRIHHTNEIAQSEAATDKPFVKYWLHGEHLLVEGQKMSKSLGNFLRVKNLQEKGFDPLSLRYLFLTVHYRTQMNFTWQAIAAAQTTLEKLQEQILNIKNKIEKRDRMSLSNEEPGKINKLRDSFIKAINNDLNTPQGLSVLWQVIKSNIPPSDKYDLVLLFDEVLGLDLGITNHESRITKIPKEITRLIKKREQLRKKKKWQEADRLRKEIEGKRYMVEDTAEGPLVKPVRK